MAKEKQQNKSNNDRLKKQVNKKEKAKYEKERAEKARRERIDDNERVHLFSRGKNFDFGLLIIIIALITIGLIMILSASAPYSLRTEGDSYFYFSKQLMFAGIGLVLMFIVSKFDYRILNSRLSWLAYIGGLRPYVLGFSARDRC